MIRFWAASVLTLLISMNADANRYFQRVPLSEAHLVFGRTMGETMNHDSIKVLIWNIKKASEPAWQTEFTKFGNNRDLFIIQEAYPNALFNLTLAALGNYQWDMGISFRYVAYDYLPTGTMIGSKELRDDFLVTHSPDYEPVTETPKAVTFSRYNNLLVANIHGVNFTDFKPFVRHMKQIEDEINTHEGRVIIAGDFNTRTKERIQYMYAMMKRLKMKEVIFKNADQRMRAKFTDNILDYAFVRGLSVKEAEVIGDAKGSDHKPMLIEMAFNHE